MKLHWSTLRPAVTYTSGAWIPKGSVKQKLLLFERSVVSRRVYGPTEMISGHWRMNLKKLNM